MKDIVPAEIIVRDVCRVKKGERVLIVANPETNMIAQDLFEAVKKAGGVPVLMFQTVKNSFDNASPEVLASIATNPDLCFSVSSSKLGKDPGAAAHPYVDAKGTKFMHIFDFLLNGKKIDARRVDAGHHAGDVRTCGSDRLQRARLSLCGVKKSV